MIDTLYEYTSKWSLSVDINKTKIVVLRKGDRVNVDQKWYNDNKEIKTVDDFTYLNVLSNFYGKYNLLQQKLSQQGTQEYLL